jgi:formylglycine-generating enzyme required for sulfatase activity
VNELGLCDMSGNLWEWTADAFNLKPENKSLRGGSWYRQATDLRVSNRYSNPPGARTSNYGFRLAHTQGDSK